MSLFNKIKCFVALVLLFYVFYLNNYKCVEMRENPLHTRVDQVFHPLARHHAAGCELLAKAHQFVQPYLDQTHAFLDEHIHEKPWFKQYKIEEKIQAAKHQFHQVVDPVLQQVFQSFDGFEKQAYDVVAKYTNEGKKFVDQKVKKD